MLPRILIAAPTSRYKDYCLKEWRDQVTSFKYPKYDVVLCDNSPDPDYHEKLWRYGLQSVHLQRADPNFPAQHHPFEILALSMNVLRDIFLQGDYEYWFILETDVFVPDWIIHHLIAQPYKVTNVSYLLWEGEERAPALHMQGSAGTKMVDPITGFNVFNGECREMTEIKIGEGLRYWGTGYGCTMVHRSVIEQVTFRTSTDNDRLTGKATAPDTFFHKDVHELGIANYIETGIIADHWRGNWNNLY